MADAKISGLNDATPLQAGDIIPIVRGGANDRVTYTPLNALGTHAARPAAAPANAGVNYYETDTGRVFQSTGTVWTMIGSLAYGDLSGIPATFAPSAHQATHIPGGADALPWTTIHGQGTNAARPAAAASNAAFVYYETDTGRLFRSNGAAWVMIGSLAYADLSGAPASLPPSGAAGGVLAGTFPNPTLALDRARQLSPTAVKTAPTYTAAANELVLVDTTSNVVTVTLPTAPADKTVVAVKHVIQGGFNTVTVASAGGDVFDKAGGSTTATLTVLMQTHTYQYNASAGIWHIINNHLPLSQLDTRYLPTSYSTGGDLLYSTNYQVGAITVAFATAEPGVSILSITGLFDGSPCIFEVNLPDVVTAAALNAHVTLNLTEDGTDTGRRARLLARSAAGLESSLFCRFAHVPPITSNALTQHTYDVMAWSGVGNGTINCGAEGAGAFGPIEFKIYRAVNA